MQTKITADSTAGEIYKRYQENVHQTEELQADILKGIIGGEDTYHLLLLAIKAISIMTSDTHFYDQAIADSRMVYGDVLGKKEPVEDKLREVEARCEKVRAAVDAENEPQRKDRLRRSLEAHEERIRVLKKELESK